MTTRCVPVGLAFLALTTVAIPGQTPRPEPGSMAQFYKGLTWRNIGPFRGGRSTAVAGVPSAPHTFYFGACGGGLWKTSNAGHSWTNISDKHIKTGTIGAIAVADSDPNVIYVGTGEAPVRGVTTSHGDGVYKSTDRGKTFHNVGLTSTRQISAIRVHPRDPETVWVAAQGNPWGPSPDRGVYRSRDGGKSWMRVLSGNDYTGAADLTIDATNPRILYAAMWDHHRKPWQVRSGGGAGGSGLYKSVDGGDSWKRLEKGLPKGVGKMGIVVSPADPQRVYAIIESDEGGLYRSDNGGDSWRLMNTKRVLRARSWYYMHIFADPVDADTVYVLNAPMMKSIDGGKTFTRISTPHGDNHALWINPLDPASMINGNDGGANVSLDGGKSWSTQGNQPTAQFYRVNTDNRFPFWVYGGQQDNSTVAIASRTFDGGIGAGDWYSVGGGESAHIAFDANNPRYVYATSILGVITEFDSRTRNSRSIQPYPQFVLGADARDYRYRYNWNPPVMVSQHDPKTIYFGGNILLRSTDRGHSWQEVSPDLTRNDDTKQGRGGIPYTNEAASAEIYNTIFYIAESSHDRKTIWVGTDDGLVHATFDGGKNWRNLTPPDLGETQINSIEVSPHDASKVYLSVTGYKLNDFSPHIYRTDDNGKTWQELGEGLPEDTFVRGVREDPKRRGLLYAGTEAGMFVSFDDGKQWQSLRLNLPPVPITDLMVRRGSLVVATQGRAFWILDDLAPLRELDAAIAKANHHLFKTSDPYRTMRAGRFQRKPGTNPKAGAIVRMFFKKKPDPEKTPVAIEILDASGNVIRRYRNQKSELSMVYGEAQESYRREQAKPYGMLKLKAGMNELVWDLRRENIKIVTSHLVPSGWQGPRVIPGEYKVRLTVAEKVTETAFRVLDDPRRGGERRDFEEFDVALRAVYRSTNELHTAITRMRAVRTQTEAMIETTRGHKNAAALAKECQSIITSILNWEKTVIQEQRETQQDVANFENRLSMQLLALLGNIDSSDAPVTAGAAQRLTDLQAEWRAAEQTMKKILEIDVAKLNALFRQNTVQTVHVPERR